MKNLFLFLLLGSGLFILAFWNLAELEVLDGDADLKVCFGPEPKTLDPAIATGSVAMQYIRALQEGLVRYDKKNPLKAIPGMAKSWRISKDLKTYTFFLRKNARWSNGDPLKARDFYYSWKRILDLNIDCEYIYFFDYIKDASAYSKAKLAKLALHKLARLSGVSKKIALLRGSILQGIRRDGLPLLEKLLQKETDPKIREGLQKALEKSRTRKAISFSQVGIEVLGPSTLRVTLAEPTAYILDIFGFTTLLPVPQKALEKAGEKWFKPKNILCSGPYVITKWKPHYMILLEKNPYYYDAKNVALQKIACYIIDQPATALNYYERGYIDFLDKTMIPTDFVESLMKRKDFHKTSSLATTFLRFNVTRPPFDNPLVRRAFAMAIDKREIVEALRTGEDPTDVLVPPFKTYLAFQPKGLSYHPQKARQLLKQVYPDLSAFPRLEYLSSSTGAKNRDIFMILRNQLKKNLGIEIEPAFQEWLVYLDSLSQGRYNLCMGAWIGDYADPNTFLDMWLSGSGNNRTGWEDSQYDGWIRKATGILNEKKRMTLLAKCEKRILQEACIIVPLYFRTGYFMAKPRVRGPVPNVMGRFPLKNFWMAK